MAVRGIWLPPRSAKKYWQGEKVPQAVALFEKMVAEYALRGMTKAIGVSEYQLTRALPREFQSSLPSIEEIEAELEGVKKGKKKTAPKNVKGKEHK